MVSRSDRARQFLPFDALKGLQEALRAKEIELEERKELSEEIMQELSDKLQMIEKEDNVKITYYHQQRYWTIQGKVISKKPIQKKLILENDIKINFIDIINIEIF